MKQKKGIFINLLLCFASNITLLSSQTITPFYNIRSQGVNAARQLVGMTNYINKSFQDTLYGAISVTPEYARSFKSENIARCLFGCYAKGDCANIKISGSRVPDRGKTDWLADYFYLPTDFESVITFKPKIDNFIVDFNFYLGLDKWYRGVYFSLYAPLVHSRWDLNFNECIIQPGVLDHEPGYFNAEEIGIARTNLLNSFTEYVNGLSIMDTNTITPVVFQKLCNAKMSTKRRIRTRFADVRLTLGWNGLQRDDYQLGIFLQAAAPTSNKPEGTYLFEPLTGTHNWELVGGIRGFYKKCKSKDKHASLHFEARVSHLFAKRHTRTFDLKNKPFSRYMLAQKMNSTITGSLQGDGVTPSSQFTHEFAPVANLSTVEIDVNMGFQADIVLMANVTWNDWSFDIGTNFWARSCEKFDRMTICEPLRNRNWALKGDTHVYGFLDAAGTTLAEDAPVPLSATMSKAVITHGDNFGQDGVAVNSAEETAGKKNPNIDNPELATAEGVALNFEPSAPANSQINTSINPVVIDPNDIDLVGTKGSSWKLFGHISYSWSEREEWTPFFGIGGEVEWGHNKDKNTCDNKCDRCITCALSQWGIWAKGGITFD